MMDWQNAPEYSRKGYIYRPEVDEDDEGIRKATHCCVNRIDPTDVMIAPNLPYYFLTKQQFEDFVDVMLITRGLA